MAYADSIRSTTATMETVASLIEGIGSASHSLTWTTWNPGDDTQMGGLGTLDVTAVTVTVSKYVQIGKFVVCKIACTLTLSGTGAAISFLLPVTAAAPTMGIGWARTYDGAADTGHFALSSTDYTKCYVYVDAAHSNWDVSGGGAGRTFEGIFIYEAA